MVNRLAFLAVLLFLPFVIKAQGTRTAIYHEIQSGDYYGKIAPLYNTKVDLLKEWNPEVNPTNLKVGQKIIVGWEEVVKEQESDGTISENHEVDPALVVEPQKEDPVEVGGDSEVFGDGGAEQQIEDEQKVEPKQKTKQETKQKLEQNTVTTPPRSYSWVWLLLGVLVGLVLGGTLVYLMLVKKLKAELEYKENELYRANSDLSSEKTNTNSELSRLRSKVQTLEREKQGLFDENDSLRGEIERMKAVQQRVNENRMDQTSSISTNQVSNQTSGPLTTVYADAIIDDYFVKIRETPNEDSIFVLHLNGENSADFSIYKSAYQRVVANPSFLEGCEKQILGDTMQLEILSQGKAQREASNGKWKVINKLNVIIR